MIAGMLKGVFVIWRHKSDKETIYDWGIYQVPFDPHPMGYNPEIICEDSVPVYTAQDPQAILQGDIDRATQVLIAKLTDQMKTRSDLARVRQQFGRLQDKGGAKPRPPVEVVDDHDWNLLWARTVGGV